MEPKEKIVGTHTRTNPPEKCKTSFVQQYQCNKELPTPQFVKDFLDREHNISADGCLHAEIQELWANGIITTGACCGNHANSDGCPSFIGVAFKNILAMKELGYEVRFNPMRPLCEDSFIPKTEFTSHG